MTASFLKALALLFVKYLYREENPNDCLHVGFLELISMQGATIRSEECTSRLRKNIADRLRL
jgi:hypothetical protein